MSDECTELRRLNRDTFDAEEKKKIGGDDWDKFLRRVLADEFIIRRSNPIIHNQNREEMINHIEKSPAAERNLLADEVVAWCNETLGVVTCPVTMSDKGGKLHRYQNIKVFKKQPQEHWQCVYWQATEATPHKATESAVLAQYAEVCKSYHAISEFRGKLLALLPIVSGTGISLLISNENELLDPSHLFSVGLFGAFVTLGLFFLRIAWYTAM